MRFAHWARKQLQPLGGKVINPAIETAAFGFIDDVEREREPWVGLTQKPFRGRTLWLFGAPGCVLTSLRIGNTEQVISAIPFEMFDRPFSRTDVRAMLHPGEHNDLMNITNRRCQKALNYSPRLVLPTQGPGVQLWLGTTGMVSGVLLIGEQID